MLPCLLNIPDKCYLLFLSNAVSWLYTTTLVGLMSSVVSEIWQAKQHPRTASLAEGWETTTPLPTPRQLREMVPLSQELVAFQATTRQEIADILTYHGGRRLLIVGPCSLHDVEATLEYALRLKALAREVRRSFCIIMRCHFEKPRTSSGWKGMLYDPFLDGSYDVAAGLSMTRRLLRDILELGVPIAAEFLTATTPQYLGDVVSYGFVGARTVASQPHRQLASGLPMPVGVKNGTDGTLDAAIHTVSLIQEQHVFIGMDCDGKPVRVKTRGNPHSHLVLRGGDGGPNYHPGDIAETLSVLRQAGLKERLIVDCSHDNCGKVYGKQAEVFMNVVEQMVDNGFIRGLALESNLLPGRQDLTKHTPPHRGVSLTDPCLDIDATEELILAARARLRGSP